MNIFVLDKDPVVAAQSQCDRHVVKMILESAQILSTVMRTKGFEVGYKATHQRHPCTLWAGKTWANYEWLYEHFLALGEEYTHRYGKVHKSMGLADALKPPAHNDKMTEFALAMPDECKTNDPVESYRKYYRHKKDIISMTWKNREIPSWFME